jgi:hypothetical protein
MYQVFLYFIAVLMGRIPMSNFGVGLSEASSPRHASTSESHLLHLPVRSPAPLDPSVPPLRFPVLRSPPLRGGRKMDASSGALYNQLKVRKNAVVLRVISGVAFRLSPCGRRGVLIPSLLFVPRQEYFRTYSSRGGILCIMLPFAHCL